MLPNRNLSDCISSGFTSRCAPRSLSDLDREKITILQTADIIVLDKPSDMRMDGDFEVTVENLLLSWLGISKRSKDAHTMPRWIHQLDFATSGVLCVALTKRAASFGCSQFEYRQTKKEYYAVVHGHLDPSTFPLLSHRPAEATSVEEAVPIAPNDPSHTLSWQDQARLDNLAIHYNILSELRRNLPTSEVNSSGLTAALASLVSGKGPGSECGQGVAINDEMVQTFKSLVDVSLEKFSKWAKLRKKLRKFLRLLHLVTADELVESVSLYSTAYVEGKPAAMAVIRADPTVPSRDPKHVRHFTDETRPVSAFRLQEGGPLYCTYPICEVQEEFRMVIPPEYQPIQNTGVVSDTSGLKWMAPKPCETCIEVLAFGTYMNKPVTKLKLSPLTGRRHQLRLHCLALGHPIVGDETYVANSSDQEQAERLMLHARMLQISFPQSFIDGGIPPQIISSGLEVPTRKRSHQEIAATIAASGDPEVESSDSFQAVVFEAPDPFIIDARDGILRVSLTGALTGGTNKPHTPSSGSVSSDS